MIVTIRPIFFLLTAFTPILTVFGAEGHEVTDIIVKSFNMNKAKLWPNDIINDDDFKQFLNGQNVQGFIKNIKNYELFQKHISAYLECHLFFQIFPDLDRRHVDLFTQDWVVQKKRSKKTDEKYSTFFEQFSSNQRFGNGDFSVIDEHDLEVLFEQVLASGIDLALLRQQENVDEKNLYDGIFKSIESGQFEKCLSKITRWWVLVADEIITLDQRLSSLYSGFQRF